MVISRIVRYEITLIMIKIEFQFQQESSNIYTALIL